MKLINEFLFLTPLWLLLLPIAWWLVWLFSRLVQKQSMWSLTCDAKLLPLLMPSQSNRKHKCGLPLLLAAVCSIGIIALAGPSWQRQNNPILESTAARVLILDLSRSMLVEDIKPNRLDLAINTLRTIITSEFVGETGLVVFAGASFVVSPLTQDANTLLEFSEALHPDTMPVDGGRLDLAITKASALLLSSITRKGKIIILTDGLTDDETDRRDEANGVSHIGAVLESARSASSQSHEVSVLAFGSPQGAPMKDVRGNLIRDEQGGFKLAKTNFTQLKEIALQGQGRFAKIDKLEPSLESFIIELDVFNHQSGEASDLMGEDGANNIGYENSGALIVWLMLPIALLLFRKNVFWIVLIAITAPVDNNLYAMDFSELWRSAEQRAFSAYQKGNYQQVILLSKDPSLVGAALFEAKDYGAAFDSFSLQSNSAESFYNQGNALAFQQKFERALLAYEQALTMKPNFEDAKINKQLIQSYLLENVNSERLGDENTNETIDGLLDENLPQPTIGQSEAIDGSRSSDQSGLGAGSLYLPGKIIDDDKFDGIEVTLEQLTLRMQGQDYPPDPEQLKMWTQNLTHSPVELFRRKFLRDYQKSKSGPIDR